MAEGISPHITENATVFKSLPRSLRKAHKFLISNIFLFIYRIFVENYTSIVYYRIAFYTLSDAYFHYLERKNEILNNDLGDMGMAPNRPSYTNVKGGLGVVAGYQVQYTPWVRW